jgi:hypothetical protein
MSYVVGPSVANGEITGIVVAGEAEKASEISAAMIKLLNDRFIVTTPAAIEYDRYGVWAYAWVRGVAGRSFTRETVGNATASKQVAILIGTANRPPITTIQQLIDDASTMLADGAVRSFADAIVKPLSAIPTVLREQFPDLTRTVIIAISVVVGILGLVALLWLFAQLAPIFRGAQSVVGA